MGLFFSIQVERQKAQQALQRAKVVPMQQAHFAQDTVSSKLKKAPSGPPPDRSQVGGQAKSPSTTPTKSVPFERECCHEMTLEMTPKSPRRKLEDQARLSFLSSFFYIFIFYPITSIPITANHPQQHPLLLAF